MPDGTTILKTAAMLHVTMLEDAILASNGVWRDVGPYQRAFIELTGAALVGTDTIEIHSSPASSVPAAATAGHVIHTFAAGGDGFWELPEVPRHIKAVRVIDGAAPANAGVTFKMTRPRGDA